MFYEVKVNLKVKKVVSAPTMAERGQRVFALNKVPQIESRVFEPLNETKWCQSVSSKDIFASF
jgi:hypothetical protein